MIVTMDSCNKEKVTFFEMKECLKTMYRDVKVKSGECVKVAREAGLTTKVRVYCRWK